VVGEEELLDHVAELAVIVLATGQVPVGEVQEKTKKMQSKSKRVRE
jgi:hypothetical protein